MKKQVNLALYKSLLYCDFFFFKYTFSKTSQVYINNITNFSSYSTINLLDSIKSFKNLVRIIKFIIFKQFSSITFQITNITCLNFIKYFFNQYSISKVAVYFTTFLKSVDFLKKKKPSFYCFLGSSTSSNNSLLANLIAYDHYLVGQFKLVYKTFEEGMYRIKMDVLDFKKIIFLLIFLNKIIHYYCKILFNSIS